MKLLDEQRPLIKFSIVTPTFNAARYLAQTMASVLDQAGAFDIEYIIIDNQSTDATGAIVADFLARLERINAERKVGQVSLQMIRGTDSGMYEAINRGFSLATGNLFAWINADDLYLPEAFEKVARIFTALPQVSWLKGVTSYVDEQGARLSSGRCYLYAQELVRRGLYGREAYFIQQDSVFWRADLWRASGGLDSSFRLAGDYELWTRFARLQPLYSVDFPVSCFRKVRGQLSSDLEAYRAEQERVRRPYSLRDRLLRRFFLSFESVFPEWLGTLVFRTLCPFEPLYLVEIDAGGGRVKNSFRYRI